MSSGSVTTPPTVKVPEKKQEQKKEEPKPVVVKPKPKPQPTKEKADYGTLPGPSGWSTFYYYDPNTDVLVIKQKKAGTPKRRFAVSYVKFLSKDRFPNSVYNGLKSNVYGSRPWGMGRYYKQGGYSLWKLYCTKPECTWTITGVTKLAKFYVR